MGSAERFPLFHDFRGRRCLVVGSGEPARLRAVMLREVGATVVRARSYPAEASLEGVVFAVAAGSDEDSMRALSAAAQHRGVPVAVVDRPQLSSAIFPAVLRRPPLLIAISSGGGSPFLARHVKSLIAQAVPVRWGSLAALFADFRERVNALIGPAKRRDFWEEALHGPVAEKLWSGDREGALQSLQQLLEAHAADSAPPVRGEVWLVGAGPGDPDLLTLRALRLLQKADVVFYDRLVAPQILDLARVEARKVCVGKDKSASGAQQSEINQALQREARAGRRTLRLKGGDPLVFARGGEELLELAACGIPVTVVPGVTAATACASLAGVPLTHRDFASSVRLLTGHRRGGEVDVPWAELRSQTETLVFYMGLSGLEIICRQLMAHGREPDTPAAVIARCGMEGEGVIRGSLATLPAKIARSGLRPPTIIIVGEVARFAQERAVEAQGLDNAGAGNDG